MKTILKPKAQNSINEIISYIALQGYPDNALRFTERIDEFIDTLGVFSEKYPVCRKLSYAKRKYRCATFEKTYIFIYKVVKKQLVIYNVIHCKRLK